MAKTVSVVVTDDLDGSAGAEAVSFSLDGHGYEIDLSRGNRTRLADTLRPFIDAAAAPPAASPPGPRPRGRTGPRSAPGRQHREYRSPNEAASAPRFGARRATFRNGAYSP
jgi:hypothetical protein